MPGIFDDERGDPGPIRANPFGKWPIWPLDIVAKSLKWPTLRRFSAPCQKPDGPRRRHNHDTEQALSLWQSSFASTGDLTEKTISFTEVGENLYAFTAEGDPNTGVIIGDDSVMVMDAQATPVMAQLVIEKIREVTDKPVKYVTLSHYHAVRVLGASAYGASEIIASQTCRAMIHERGQEDWDSEYGRFPRLFDAAESIPGLTWPTTTFTAPHDGLSRQAPGRSDALWAGRTRPATSSPMCRIPGGHVHRRYRRVSSRRVIAATDTFEEWGRKRWKTSRRSWDVDAIAPGRGDALVGHEDGQCGASTARGDFRRPRPIAPVAEGGACRRVAESRPGSRLAAPPAIRKFGDYAIYEHCLPFNIARAYDEAPRRRNAAYLDRGTRSRNVGGACRAETDGRRCATPMVEDPLRHRVPALSVSARSAGPGCGERRSAIRSWWPGAGRSGMAMAQSISALKNMCRSSCSTTMTGSSVGLARDLLCQAHRWKSLDRLGCGDVDGRQGRRVEHRQGVSLIEKQIYEFQSSARGRPQTSGLHQPSTALFRKVHRSSAITCGLEAEGKPIEMRGGNHVNAITSLTCA